jgi:hypothetical protein
MNIAVIGGGFYGCYIANKLSNNHKIDIYEMAAKPCLGSIVNNQNRLHLGYHYPRCNKTIQQTINTYNQFLSEFNNCVSFVGSNIYAVHENSKVSYSDYKKVFDGFGLPHAEVKSNDVIWDNIVNKKQFSGALRTQEGVLDCSKLVGQLLGSVYSQKNIKIFCNQKITPTRMEKLKKNYDYVINCTYNDPFVGMQKSIETKDEACLIAVLKDKRYEDFGFTIMDGPFCSLYPVKDDIYSLSSVVYTPFNIKDRSYCVKSSLQNIIDHGKEYFKLDDSVLIDFYYGKKTKIKNDNHDERYSFVTQQENIISVFSGKISSIIESYSEVLNAIK